MANDTLMELTKRIEVHGRIERFFSLLRDLPLHFPQMCQDHLKFQWISGQPLTEGAIGEQEEISLGRRRRERIRVERVVPDREVVFRGITPFSPWDFQVRVELIPQEEGFVMAFHAGLGLRSGWLRFFLGGIVRRYLQRRREELEEHLAENLFAIRAMVENAEGENRASTGEK